MPSTALRPGRPARSRRSASAALIALGVLACDPGTHEAGVGGTTPGAAAIGAPTAEPIPPLAGPPQRIVPANVAAAEYLCALVDLERIAGLPEQVGDFSSFDPDAVDAARAERWNELPRFARYEAERLIALEPDLVVTFEWQAATTTELLRSKQVPVLVLPSGKSYADVRATLEQLGRLLGAEDRAARELAALDERAARLAAGAERRAGLRVLVYSNTGTGGWAPGSGTTSHAMVELAGMRNLAAEAGIEGHGRVDFERFLVLDPDVIVVNELVVGRGSASKDAVTAAPALAGLKAVREDRILVMPAALMSADSPELVTAAERLAEGVDRMLEDGLRPR